MLKHPPKTMQARPKPTENHANPNPDVENPAAKKLDFLKKGDFSDRH
jgi:hypothetical protein